jgi:(p)ppGpp synthase/HD superfamily hydrolase
MTKVTERASLFAYVAHNAIGQVRKYANDPYWHHCENVAMTVTIRGGTDEMIAAAWLHDVVEDTKIEIGDIGAFFGDAIESFVWALTDTEKGNRAERKRLSRIRLGNACAEVQTIKLADLIDNTKTIAQYDPEFAKVYMQEKRELIDVLTKGDKTLWQMANKQISDYFYDKDG